MKTNQAVLPAPPSWGAAIEGLTGVKVRTFMVDLKGKAMDIQIKDGENFVLIDRKLSFSRDDDAILDAVISAAVAIEVAAKGGDIEETRAAVYEYVGRIVPRSSLASKLKYLSSYKKRGGNLPNVLRTTVFVGEVGKSLSGPRSGIRFVPIKLTDEEKKYLASKRGLKKPLSSSQRAKFRRALQS